MEKKIFKKKVGRRVEVANGTGSDWRYKKSKIFKNLSHHPPCFDWRVKGCLARVAIAIPYIALAGNKKKSPIKKGSHLREARVAARGGGPPCFGGIKKKIIPFFNKYSILAEDLKDFKVLIKKKIKSIKLNRDYYR